MAEQVIRPNDLLTAAWRELRSEVCRWDSIDKDADGFDGFSRFWCPDAVFDVYWVGERVNSSEVALYLTDDMLLTGFKAPLPFDVSGEYLVGLAKKVHWERVAATALRSMFDRQAE